MFFEPIALFVELDQFRQFFKVYHHFGLLAVLSDVDGALLVLEVFDLNAIILI